MISLSKEAIKEFREMRLSNLTSMLAAVGSITKEAGAPVGDQILVRRELLEKQRDIQAKLDVSAELDEEEIDLLRQIVSEEEDEEGYDD